jgi:hypothetical protein
MSTNFVICSYGGKYASRHYDPTETFKLIYLRYYLSSLNTIWKEDCNVTQITIMKPTIKPGNEEIKDYYKFDDLDLDNIKHLIKIVECENRGISYGQFFTAIENDRKNNSLFDYYIFTEDDYIPFTGDFNKLLIQNYNHTIPNFLCLAMNHNDDKSHMIHSCLGIHTHVPDFSIGILSKQSIIQMYNTWNYDSIMSLFDRPDEFTMAQVLFGYIFTKSGIETTCLGEKHIALFNCNSNPLKFILNNFPVSNRYIQRIYKDEKYKLPIFVPIDLFFIPKKKEFYDLLIPYIEDRDEFDIIYEKLLSLTHKF